MTKIFKRSAAVLLSIGLLLMTACSFINNPAQDSSSKSSGSSTTTSGENDKLKVHYLDVGQGDSIFIQLPNNQTMLIDSGTYENADKIISYIKKLNYSKIDYVVGTHPHADHIGALADVIKAFDIGKIYMPNATNTGVTYENLLKAIQSKGLKITRAKAGVNILNETDLKMDIIAPVEDSYDNLNNYSAVIKLTYKTKSFLFTGDAETLSENQITADVSADVLKVGHHGSTTSTGAKFLNKVSPKYAVISVGKGNDYGHPHQKTLDKLTSAGCEIFRTDLLGTIVISSDGDKININQKQTTNENTNATTSKADSTAPKYILNTKTKKIHTSTCSSVATISKENYAETDDFGKAIDDGYEPCKTCNPD